MEDVNYKIIWAKDGVEAVELFKANKIDLILMGISMPNRNGIEATKMIKAINKKIPIIAQTAFFLEQDKIKILEAGCDDILKKPISQLKLKQTISKYLNQY